MSTVATLVESLLTPRQGVILDDRRLPLFKVLKRVRESDRTAFWHARVVDQELLAQGAPEEVMLQIISLPPELPPAMLARALECCLVDHPRIQLVHSAALPASTLYAVQPAEPSPLLPPLHSLPLADEAVAVILVKEWIETVQLLTWRQNRGSGLRLSDILDLLDTTSEALAALHRRGYAHGALTPDSIALQELASPTMPGQEEETVWVPKLTDLGLTRTLAPAGTWPTGPAALWCAPESFLPDAMTDWRRVDQLSIAAILFALWTDQIPFDAMPANTSPAEARELRRRQIEALPPPRGNARARALGVTPAMSAACMRAMSPDPKDRFPSLDAFGSALRQASRENARRAASGDEEPGTGTQPGTYVGSKFRSLTVPPQLRAQAGGEPKAEPRSRPTPLQVPRGPVPDAPEAPLASAGAMWGTSDDDDEPGLVRVLSDEGPSTFDPLADRRARPRRTQILSQPADDTGEYPAHPDDDERDDSSPDTSPLLEAGIVTHRWAFNNLAAVLLGLWLLTFVAFLVKGPSADDKPSAAAAAAAKVEKKGAGKNAKAAVEDGQ